MAISFCNFDELAYLKDIEKLTRKRIPVVEDHPWPMEIFEATPKAARPPRPPRAERQAQPLPAKTVPNAAKSAGGTAGPLFPAAKAPDKEPKPPAPVFSAPQPAPAPPKPPLRRISSEPPRVGRLVAFADGRRGKRRSGGKKPVSSPQNRPRKAQSDQ